MTSARRLYRGRMTPWPSVISTAAGADDPGYGSLAPPANTVLHDHRGVPVLTTRQLHSAASQTKLAKPEHAGALGRTSVHFPRTEWAPASAGPYPPRRTRAWTTEQLPARRRIRENSGPVLVDGKWPLSKIQMYENKIRSRWIATATPILPGPPTTPEKPGSTISSGRDRERKVSETMTCLPRRQPC